MTITKTQFRHLTKFPKIFNTQWGTLKGNFDPEIIENRNMFVEKFNIRRNASGYIYSKFIFFRCSKYNINLFELFETSGKLIVLLCHFPRSKRGRLFVKDIRTIGELHLFSSPALYSSKHESFVSIFPDKKSFKDWAYSFY